MSVSPSSTIVALVPAPSGYHVDFENPQRRGIPTAYWVTGFGLLFSTSFLIMRLYTKLRIVREFKAEDWCFALSYVFGFAVQMMLVYVWAAKIASVHIWEESVDQYNVFVVVVIVSACLYTVCLALAKTSLLLFYYRMSRFRWFMVLSIITIVLIVGYNIATIFALIFPCQPLAKAWDATITEGSCINRGALYLSIAVWNIATDLVLLILPIPLVWRLKMPRTQKFGLVFIFVIGSITFVTSIIRLVLLLPTLTTVDQPWAIALPGMWVNIEANLVIICCSLPALRVFVRHFAPKFMGEYSADRSRPSYHPNDGSKANTGQFGSKLQEKMRSRSSYGRMDILEIEDRDLELQDKFPKVWSECHRVSRESKVGVTHLEDITPPSSELESRQSSPNRDIVVTTTFG